MSAVIVIEECPRQLDTFFRDTPWAMSKLALVCRIKSKRLDFIKHSFYRLARRTKDLLDIVEQLQGDQLSEQ